MEKITSVNMKSIVAKVNEIVEVITLIPDKYDDTKLRDDMSKKIDDGISDLSKRQDELARAQNAIENHDDSSVLGKLAEIEKSIESLDRRLDFIRRTYSEKWESMQLKRVNDSKVLNDNLSALESDISELKKSFNEIFE